MIRDVVGNLSGFKKKAIETLCFTCVKGRTNPSSCGFSMAQRMEMIDFGISKNPCRHYKKEK